MSGNLAPSGAPNIQHAKAWLESTVSELHELAHTTGTSALGDIAATVSDVAKRAPLPVEHGAVVVAQASAIEAYSEAMTLLLAAQVWAQDASDIIITTDAKAQEFGVEGDVIDEMALVETASRRERVITMELSLHRCLSHLMIVNQDHDGPVTVSRDGQGSFFWRHVQSGYHGGIIFHPDYAEKGTKRLPVGTWSIHT